MSNQMNIFKSNLLIFANKYKYELNNNPIFRAQFQSMCNSIGIDPLASKKGYWAELLGVGEFYFELAVQIVEICVATRNKNGGLIRLDELLFKIKKKRGLKPEDTSISEYKIINFI